MIRGLVPELHDQGINAEVLATDKGLSENDRDLDGVSWLRLTKSVGPASITYSPNFAKVMREIVRDFDLVHVHGFQSYPGSTAMRIARHAGIPYLVEPHGALDNYHWRQNPLRKRAWQYVMDRKNLSGLQGAIYSSPLEQNQASATLAKVISYLIPLGVDDSLFDITQDPVPGGLIKVAYVGRITRKKRVDLALRAIAEPVLAARGVRLVVAGGSDGTIQDPQLIAEAAGVLPRVEILGQVNADARRRILSECAVFVLPSEDESFGMAAAEAMAAGMRVVTSRFVGIAEAAEKEAASLTADNNPAAIARQIAAALDDPELGNRARDYAKTHFRWSLTAQALREVYASAVTGDYR